MCTCRETRVEGLHCPREAVSTKDPSLKMAVTMVSMKVGVFIIASLYNDGFICCRIIGSWFVQTRGSMEGGCTLAFDKVKGG